MRPDDLMWNDWVNDFLIGKKPPFDILAWNADKTNLPAALHGQFQHVLTVPGGMTVLGSPVDLSQVKVDAYTTAAPPIPRPLAGAIAPHGYSGRYDVRAG